MAIYFNSVSRISGLVRILEPSTALSYPATLDTFAQEMSTSYDINGFMPTDYSDLITSTPQSGTLEDGTVYNGIDFLQQSIDYGAYEASFAIFRNNSSTTEKAWVVGISEWDNNPPLKTSIWESPTVGNEFGIFFNASHPVSSLSTFDGTTGFFIQGAIEGDLGIYNLITQY